ncbi:MarR family winged helix-turn-helix transcriptional regulator [Propioniciclava sinopodophylli]|uniref:MarR family winged helix-turn-helix transcriptional regulator n=1 Tax=Propioniciclava sinopodophylli TaxID=1837344 RepID=UPI0024931964|nr:MarR family transcriptional regulator [Propioniciclava sinopodophylli]
MDIPEVTETDLADLILRVARQLRRANADELAGTPLNPHQARALRLVARLEPVRMADLAERLHVAPRSATDVVEVLVGGGWVERTADPMDGRSRVVRLTSAGQGLVAEVDAARARAASQVLAPLGPADRASVASGLRAATDAAGPRSLT